MENQDLSYGDACGLATRSSMRADNKVLVYGLGVDDPKGMYGTTKGLVEEFGEDRCFDTPLSEDSMTGFGIGMAVEGFRPIHVHQRFDFILLCLNQLVNMASKSRYVSNNRYSCPLVIRAIVGRSWGQGIQHSQSFHSFCSSIPGLTVLAPVTSHDMYNCIRWSTKYDNPTIIMEHRMLYNRKGIVSEDVNYKPGLRKLSSGQDFTLCSVSYSCIEAERAIKALAKKGIRGDHFNIVNLTDIDMDSIFDSASATGNFIFVDNGWTKCSIGSEVISNLAIKGFSGRSRLLGFLPTPCPSPRSLDKIYYPRPIDIGGTILTLLSKNNIIIKYEDNSEIESFRGPF